MMKLSFKLDNDLKLQIRLLTQLPVKDVLGLRYVAYIHKPIAYVKIVIQKSEQWATRLMIQYVWYYTGA